MPPSDRSDHQSDDGPGLPKWCWHLGPARLPWPSKAGRRGLPRGQRTKDRLRLLKIGGRELEWQNHDSVKKKKKNSAKGETGTRSLSLKGGGTEEEPVVCLVFFFMSKFYFSPEMSMPNTNAIPLKQQNKRWGEVGRAFLEFGSA